MLRMIQSYAGSGFIPNFVATGLRHTGYANTPAMFKNPVKGTRTQTLTEKQEDGAKARGGLLNILNGGLPCLFLGLRTQYQWRGR